MCSALAGLMSREDLSAALAKMNADVAAAGGKMTVGTPRAFERAALAGSAARASLSRSRLASQFSWLYAVPLALMTLDSRAEGAGCGVCVQG